MNIHLTFDIEVWCKSWNTLDADFPASFERYVYGRSSKGEYALPKVLEILARHQLTGVFFVEPLFAKRFGAQYLSKIVTLIKDAGQDVQLHLHPEWTDEIRPPLIENIAHKRQHLSYYTHQEQTTLIGVGRQMLEDAGSGSITAFRAGSFGANLDTLVALEKNGILIDSSLNACYEISAPELRANHDFSTPFKVGAVLTYPMSIFKDGFGKLRPAQIGSCSVQELQQAICEAARAGHEHFVLLSHNFEMLKPGSSEPDQTVVKRFESLCAWLAEHKDKFPSTTFDAMYVPPNKDIGWAHVGFLPSARRLAEQVWRRLSN